MRQESTTHGRPACSSQVLDEKAIRSAALAAETERLASANCGLGLPARSYWVPLNESWPCSASGADQGNAGVILVIKTVFHTIGHVMASSLSGSLLMSTGEIVTAPPLEPALVSVRSARAPPALGQLTLEEPKTLETPPIVMSLSVGLVFRRRLKSKSRPSGRDLLLLPAMRTESEPLTARVEIVRNESEGGPGPAAILNFVTLQPTPLIVTPDACSRLAESGSAQREVSMPLLTLHACSCGDAMQRPQ